MKPNDSLQPVLIEVSLSISAILPRLTQDLAPVTDTPRIDAQVLLAHVLQMPRSWVIAHPEARLSPDQSQALESTLTRLGQGEALPYILGHWEFFGLDFLVTPSVLIPRPETELLVEQALAWLASNPSRRLAADVGTGSGCIGVSLAVRIPDLKVIASDISLEALKVACANASRHQVRDQITLIQADLLQGLASRFDLICANLPYIPSHVLRNLAVSRREPSLALDGGADGLESIRPMLVQSAQKLKPGGLLLMEIEASKGPYVLSLAKDCFPEAAISLLPDLASHERLLVVETRPEI